MNMGDTLALQESAVACTTPHLFGFGSNEVSLAWAPYLKDLHFFTEKLVEVILKYNSHAGDYPVHRLGFVFGVLAESQTLGRARLKEFGFTFFESRKCHKYNHTLTMATMDCQELHERIAELDPKGYEEIRRATLHRSNPLPELPKKGKT